MIAPKRNITHSIPTFQVVDIEARFSSSDKLVFCGRWRLRIFLEIELKFCDFLEILCDKILFRIYFYIENHFLPVS